MVVTKDLGDIQVGEEIEIIFNIEREEGYISVTSSCGCAEPRYGDDRKSIIIDYIPKKVPMHLKERGYYFDEKTVTAITKDRDIDKYIFKAKVWTKI